MEKKVKKSEKEKTKIKVKESTKEKAKINAKEATKEKVKTNAKESANKSTKEITKKNTKIITKENTKKLNMLLFVIAAIVIIIVIIKLLSGKNETIMINKNVNIEIGGYNQIVKVNYVTKNINVDDNKYMLVNIDIENKKNIDSNTSYHQFYLIDVNGNEAAPCYHSGMVNNSNFKNIFPDIIKANSTTKGNLYCPINNTDIRQFKIKVISGGSIDSDNKVNYEYSDYYVDLKD